MTMIKTTVGLSSIADFLEDRESLVEGRKVISHELSVIIDGDGWGDHLYDVTLTNRIVPCDSLLFMVIDGMDYRYWEDK